MAMWRVTSISAPREHPVALQLGGSAPTDLAQCARLAQRWGYDEVNLNCGCPSDSRAAPRAFGACLMAEPALVRDCVAAMRDCSFAASHREAPHRHRSIESYGFVRDLRRRGGRGRLQRVHRARSQRAWLDGLSPKRNRESAAAAP